MKTIRSLIQGAFEIARAAKSIGGKPAAWIPLARVEGDESMVPASDRITPEFLKATAASYDAKQRRAPIVSGDGPVRGPAHKVGEMNPPLGWIERVEFDGLNLWGLAVDSGGRLLRAMKDGFAKGSVAIWNSLPEADGGPYLRHFAYLGAEAAGTTNLPDLDRYFAGFDVADEATARSLQGAPYITRSLPDDREQEDSMDEKLKEALDAIARSVEGVAQGQADLKASNEKLAGEVEGLNAKVADLETKTGEAVRSAQDLAKKATETRYRSAVEALRDSGRVPPSEVEAEVEILTQRSAEDAEARLKTLGERAPLKFEERKLEVERGEIPDGFLTARDLEHPNRRSGDPKAHALVARAMAEAKGDPKEYRKILYALAGEAN